MLHRLYMRTLALAAAPGAPWWLAAIAFAESSFFPIPPDALLIPMALARPERPSTVALAAMAEAWRPWRAVAAVLLWFSGW